MAHFDYQLELEARLEEEGTAPDTEAAFEILANHRIREAMRVGDFDELPGKGQPLNRTEDSSDISVKILKNANVLPEWVEVGKVVRERVRGLRASIEPFVKQVVEAQPASLADAMRQLKGVPGWVSAKGEFQVRLDKVNAEIAKHNRMAPNAVMHMMPIKLETEVSALYMKLTNR
jgi:DnaJ family protein C protein 28